MRSPMLERTLSNRFAVVAYGVAEFSPSALIATRAFAGGKSNRKTAPRSNMPALGLAIFMAFGPACAQDATQQGARQSPPVPAKPPEAAEPRAFDCALRLKGFVEELDQVLSNRPRTIHVVRDVSKKYFPLKHCDIQEAITISRRSRYFKRADDMPKYYAIIFDSKPAFPFSYSSDLGFYVQFSLWKDSGNSSGPFEKVNK
jgi:hypothetical protein